METENFKNDYVVLFYSCGFIICIAGLNTKIQKYCLYLLWFILVSFVWMQGIKQTDHFGFICRDPAESGPSQYVCYVFQCASESLVSHTEDVKDNDFSFCS